MREFESSIELNTGLDKWKISLTAHWNLNTYAKMKNESKEKADLSR